MNSLLRKNRKVAKTVTVDLDGEAIVLDIVKPTVGDRLRFAEDAQKAGEIDADSKPTSQFAQMRTAARMLTFILFKDGQPVFARGDVDAVLDLDEAALTKLMNEAAPVFFEQKDTETLGNS